MSRLTKCYILISLVYSTACMAGAEEKHHQQNQSSGRHHHGHGHIHTPHMGVIAPILSDTIPSGFAELKLHDDKGDLELWLTNNDTVTQPLDLPLNTVIKVSFPDLDFKTVELRIRNSEENEDEAGCNNIRNGKTNYFIFPGDTGVDSSFLIGSDFIAKVVISFTINETTYTTAPFTLRPHTH